MKTVNVFVLGTEYHFLMAYFIIQEHFNTDNFENRVVFLGKRLRQIDKQRLPQNINTIEFFIETEKNPAKKAREEILKGEVSNLFMVNVYRPADTMIVSMASKKTRRHLIQDGALFYHRIEKSLWKNRVKVTCEIYTALWKTGYFFRDIIWYGRFMEESNYIDEVWMTNPNEYIGPPIKKKLNIINFLPHKDSLQNVLSFFHGEVNIPADMVNYLIYLSPIIKVAEHIDIEIHQIIQLLQRLRIDKVIIKLHPNTSDEHYRKLYDVFGDSVIKNCIPAELYIASAKKSIVVGCASTSLFYNNSNCRYFALKKFFQSLGIYAQWKNINLPPHVAQVDSMEDIRSLS